MIQTIIQNIHRGIRRVQDNHQLGYSILVAIFIFIAFCFVTLQFASIARDAQERLINVRVGSIHDTFSVLVGDTLTNPALLQKKVEKISEQNKTIREFIVVRFDEKTPRIIASLDERMVGRSDEVFSFLYTLAGTDTDRSFTIETNAPRERLFQTVRSLTNERGEMVAAIRTAQTLSEADKAINDSMRNSFLFFIVVVILIMLLFFRHARIIDYAVLYRRLKEVDELKDDFIAMASHELRTPLTVIRGYIDFIQKSDHLNEEEQEFAHRINISAEQLDELVSDMLDVSRMEQGRITFDNETFSVNTLTAELVESFKMRAEEKGIDVCMEASGEYTVYADKARTRQVLINLIGNAIKYTERGYVKVELKSHDEQTMIRVSDTGIGMNAQEQAKLFEKFYRVANEKTKEIRGTGLGLWLTKQLVEKMGGEISVESIKGVGTHVIVDMPATDE